MTHHGKFRSDDPCETNWKSSDLLHDSTPYYNEMNGNDMINNNDNPTNQINQSDFSPNYGDHDPSEQNWNRPYNQQYDPQQNNSNFNGFRQQGNFKRSAIDRSGFPQSFRNRNNYAPRGRGRGRGAGRGRGGRGRGMRGRGMRSRGGFRGRGRGRGLSNNREYANGGGYANNGGNYNRRGISSRGSFRGGPRYGSSRGSFRGTRGRGTFRGSFRGAPRRFSRNRKPTTKAELDRDLEKYLYGGDGGEERKKNDLDDDLDSYWNDSNINSGKKVETEDSENDKQEIDDEADKKEDNKQVEADLDEIEDDKQNDEEKASDTTGDNEVNGE